jgi:hypothetical protein
MQRRARGGAEEGRALAAGPAQELAPAGPPTLPRPETQPSSAQPGLAARARALQHMRARSFAETHAFSGDPVIVDPDVSEVRFQPDDEFLVLATDGLWDAVPVPEATAAARRLFAAGRDARGVAEGLVELALKRYTNDNVSVVVVDLGRPRVADGGGGWLGGLFGR